MRRERVAVGQQPDLVAVIPYYASAGIIANTGTVDVVVDDRPDLASGLTIPVAVAVTFPSGVNGQALQLWASAAATAGGEVTFYLPGLGDEL